MEISKKRLSSSTVAGIILIMLLSVMALAATPAARADTGDDLVKALGTQRYYVSEGVKTNKTFMDKNPNLEQQLRDAVNRLKGDKDSRLAVISNAIVPTNFNNNTEGYGNFLYGFLNKPEVLVLVNAEREVVSLFSDKLTEAERRSITDEARSSFGTKGYAATTIQIADKAVEKIQSKQTSGTLTTAGIILVVLVVIAGGVAYMLITTKKNWKRKVTGVEELANQVSDQVVRVSDEVNFLPDAARANTDADFGFATRNFSDANSQLRELQKVSPVTLLLKGPDYERKLNLTGAQFEQARQALSKVEQQVKALPGL